EGFRGAIHGAAASRECNGGAIDRSRALSGGAIHSVVCACSRVALKRGIVDEYLPNRPIAIDAESSTHYGGALAGHIVHGAKTWLQILTKNVGFPDCVKPVAELHESEGRIELGQFIAVLAQRRFVLIPQPEVKGQPGSKAPIILDKGSDVRASYEHAGITKEIR